ncbi:DsbA family protein [Actinomadura rayongensis]|uniref:Thioredoxin domain-containing protein n=1 Tax=Actinomadura rayongensis TaxID=1429076 RepID=A0A6I4W770_9ACTN|nr:thioredoxin domain-containing protein [Actinomadura rayongensis]MXQ64105.1 thioredoxin domain-containing protein [Actinomadura rayongensis]
MSKAARERSARDRLAAERARQAARQKQVRLLALVVGAVVAVAAVVAIVVVVADQKSKRNQVAHGYTGPQAPLTRESDGSIVMAKAGVTKPVLEIFEDFQCPACKQFEQSEGKTVKQLAAEGKVKVVYRPFHLFSQQQDPVKANSLRSAAAALCVPAPQWLSFHDALYEFQPTEGTDGFAPKDLVAWGKDVGVTDANFAKCVTDQQKVPQVTAMTDYARQKRQVDSTPTLFLDGQKINDQQLADLPGTVAKAAAGK